MLSIGNGTLGGVGTVTKELTEALHQRGDYQVDVLTYWPWLKDQGKDPVQLYSGDSSQPDVFGTLDEYVSSEKARTDYDAIHVHSHIFGDHYLSLGGNTIDSETFFSRYNAPKVLLTHSLTTREPWASNDKGTIVDAQRQVMGLVDKVVHLTAEQQDIARQDFPEYDDKTYVIGNGTFLPKETPKEAAKTLKEKYAPKLSIIY